MRNLLLSSCLVFFAAAGFAQHFTYKAGIDTPHATGFYQLSIPPSVIARSAVNLRDLRVVDEKSQQIPYLLDKENPVAAAVKFIDFPIISIRKQADSLTHIITQNPSAAEVKEMLLTIGNTSANRDISISGGNDSTRWYIIKENIPLEKSYGSKTQFVQAIPLPVTNYRYYNIAINGKNLVPVNILKAGINNTELRPAAYDSLPDPRVSISTKGNISYVDVFFDDRYELDELKIHVSAPQFFKRSVRVFIGDTLTGTMHGYFRVNSQEPVVLPLGVRADRLHLQVNNQDNPPLVIEAVHGFSLKRTLLARLEAGHFYELMTGDSALKAPEYDLASFADQIRQNVMNLGVKEIQRITPSDAAKPTEQRDGSLLLWVITGTVVIVLLFITWKMLNEIKTRKKEDEA